MKKGDRIVTLVLSGKELIIKEEQEIMEYYTAVDTELETQRCAREKNKGSFDSLEHLKDGSYYLCETIGLERENCHHNYRYAGGIFQAEMARGRKVLKYRTPNGTILRGTVVFKGEELKKKPKNIRILGEIIYEGGYLGYDILYT